MDSGANSYTSRVRQKVGGMKSGRIYLPHLDYPLLRRGGLRVTKDLGLISTEPGWSCGEQHDSPAVVERAWFGVHSAPDPDERRPLPEPGFHWGAI